MELDLLSKKLDRVDAKLTALLNKPAKQTWVSVSVIAELTGWEGSEKFRWARDNNLVVYNKEKGYLLESLNQLFIKNSIK